jgi:hypothetical protein
MRPKKPPEGNCRFTVEPAVGREGFAFRHVHEADACEVDKQQPAALRLLDWFKFVNSDPCQQWAKTISRMNKRRLSRSSLADARVGGTPNSSFSSPICDNCCGS